MVDLRFTNHGSIVTMVPETEAGDEWMQEHIGDGTLTWGGGVVIEPRYLEDIVLGARADGLICEG
jgi:hypothetical protein